MSLVFRVFTFSLTISLLKFYAIPLYAVLVLLAIGLGVFWNKDTDSFVIKGFQSVLFMGRQCRLSQPLMLHCVFQQMKPMGQMVMKRALPVMDEKKRMSCRATLPSKSFGSWSTCS